LLASITKVRLDVFSVSFPYKAPFNLRRWIGFRFFHSLPLVDSVELRLHIVESRDA
jgi:hypothetical protein